MIYHPYPPSIHEMICILAFLLPPLVYQMICKFHCRPIKCLKGVERLYYSPFSVCMYDSPDGCQFDFSSARMGNPKAALELIIKKLQDVDKVYIIH